MRLGDLDSLEQFFLHESKRLREFMNSEDCDQEERKYISTFLPTVEWARKTVHGISTIDAVPVKRSFWECYETSAFGGYDKDGEVRWLPRKFYRCESCRNGSAIKSKFCPNCGADMRERKDGE